MYDLLRCFRREFLNLKRSSTVLCALHTFPSLHLVGQLARLVPFLEEMLFFNKISLCSYGKALTTFSQDLQAGQTFFLLMKF